MGDHLVVKGSPGDKLTVFCIYQLRAHLDCKFGIKIRSCLIKIGTNIKHQVMP